MSDRNRRILCLCGMGACLLLLLLWETVLPHPEEATAARLWDAAVLRTLASAVMALLLWYLQEPSLRLFGKGTARLSRPWRWAAVLAALAVCINNAPLIGLATHRVQVDRPALLWLWGWCCLGIACFEEFAFRGLLLGAWLKKRGEAHMVETVVLSSAVFALTHLINLIQGASVGGTVLQVGYSFLIGAMCAVVLLATGSLLSCVLLHAVYDFGGGLIAQLGSGTLWDTPTVVITAVLAVVVTLFLTWTLLRMQRTAISQSKTAKDE